MNDQRRIAFRPCTAADVDAAVPLILSSGPESFAYAFCDRHPEQARQFLRRAYLDGSSAFGYRQHVALLVDGDIAGIGAVAYSRDNTRFTVAALRMILQAYHPLAAIRTIVRGLRVERIMKPPRAAAGVLYHIAVDEKHRGRGLGQTLVEYLTDRVRESGKVVAALDVAENNPNARRLYTRLDFDAVVTRRSHLSSDYGSVADHTYMEKNLA